MLATIRRRRPAGVDLIAREPPASVPADVTLVRPRVDEFAFGCRHVHLLGGAATGGLPVRHALLRMVAVCAIPGRRPGGGSSASVALQRWVADPAASSRPLPRRNRDKPSRVTLLWPCQGAPEAVGDGWHRRQDTIAVRRPLSRAGQPPKGRNGQRSTEVKSWRALRADDPRRHGSGPVARDTEPGVGAASGGRGEIADQAGRTADAKAST